MGVSPKSGVPLEGDIGALYGRQGKMGLRD